MNMIPWLKIWRYCTMKISPLVRWKLYSQEDQFLSFLLHYSFCLSHAAFEPKRLVRTIRASTCNLYHIVFLFFNYGNFSVFSFICIWIKFIIMKTFLIIKPFKMVMNQMLTDLVSFPECLKKWTAHFRSL